MNEKELVGVTLGNSTLERVIGKGGMSIVFLAQQARPTRTVAVKVLLPAGTGEDLDQQRVFLERFRREADTAAKLEHKNILPVYEYDEAMVNGQRLAYLVMPYIRGGTLRQRIDEFNHAGKRFDLQTVASYISQVADALSYAHSLGVIHRDIKPGNLLFHADGRLLLTDFGIARLSAMPALTMAGSFIGTAEYSSPEQVSAGDLDSRSDIYSLGIILYELLTGDVPFTGSTPFAIMARQLHDPVPSVRARRPDLSPAIEFVVKKALAKDPNARYQHATELAADLQAAVLPAAAQPSGLRLSGDAGNNDLTVSDNSWQPPAPRAIGATNPMPRVATAQAVQAAPRPPATPSPTAIPPTSPASPSPYPHLPPPPGGAAAGRPAPAQVQLPQAAPDAEESDQVKVYRPSRRLYFYIIGLVTLVLQFLMLGLVLQSFHDVAAAILSVLLGNGLNLLSLTVIGFTGITRQRDMRGIFNRQMWVSLLAFVLSGFFIAYGDASQGIYQPLISYAILLITNIYSIRMLGKADLAHEQIEVAPVAWRSAIVGALTGLIPLIIILVFALVGPWGTHPPLFLRLLGVFAISFIGAPTPGAMMAVWLSQKMSFPILVRTSAIAGFFMFVAAYVLVILIGLLASGSFFIISDFAAYPQFLPLVLILVGVLLGLIGLLRGMLDAWVYHRVMMRRA
jgi:serine/threonine protein kinase